MKPKDLRTGDIIAFAAKKWLPRQIQKFMRLQARIKYHTKLPKYYNHTMTVTEPEEMKVAEAVARGFVNQNIWKHYSEEELKDMIVFRLKEDLTGEEKQALLSEAKELADKNIEYEVLNFIWWVFYILTNGKIDFSPKGSRQAKKLFCFETSAMLLIAARPGLFPDPSKVTTVDLQMDERFENLYFD